MGMSKSTRLAARSLGILCLTVLIAACSSEESGGNQTRNLTPKITHYITGTPTPTHSIGSNRSDPPPFRLPSATPFIYSVVTNDTLIGIAFRFGIALEALIAANPGIDPNFLVVESQLIIPVQEGSTGVELPSLTPVPLTVSEVRCYATASGGAWCFLLVENEQPTALENLSALISLHSKDGEVIASQEAVALLNILPSSERLPLVTFFEGPLPTWTTASGQLLTAISIPIDDSRYLTAAIENVRTVIDASGGSAHVQGRISILTDSPPANLVWIVAVAYDQDGFPVGVRRWEHIGELPPGLVLDFVLEIFSLGAAIESVVLLYEARP